MTQEHDGNSILLDYRLTDISRSVDCNYDLRTLPGEAVQISCFRGDIIFQINGEEFGGKNLYLLDFSRALIWSIHRLIFFKESVSTDYYERSGNLTYILKDDIVLLQMIMTKAVVREAECGVLDLARAAGIFHRRVTRAALEELPSLIDNADFLKTYPEAQDLAEEIVTGRQAG